VADVLYLENVDIEGSCEKYRRLGVGVLYDSRLVKKALNVSNRDIQLV
jgi:hypothetical protein